MEGPRPTPLLPLYGNLRASMIFFTFSGVLSAMSVPFYVVMVMPL